VFDSNVVKSRCRNKKENGSLVVALNVKSLAFRTVDEYIAAVKVWPNPSNVLILKEK